MNIKRIGLIGGSNVSTGDSSVEIVNDLTTGGKNKALSAEMGKKLADDINNIKPVIINGDITNAADEEDITSEDNLLKLKDRTNLNGMGYIILRKDKLFKEQLIQSNTIYEIRYNFDIGGEIVEIPENCTLKFEGGSVKNGTITLQNTLLLGDVQIFCQLSNSSTIKNSSVIIDWFGAKSNDVTFDNADIFTNIQNITNLGEIIIPTGTYYSTSFLLPDTANLIGISKTRSIIKAIGNGKNYEYTNNNDYSVKNCFIAIRSPRSTITNLCIDGGVDEGYENVAIGMFQAGFITTISNVIIKNASIGAIDINAMGGIYNISQCEFYYGCSEFTIRTQNIVDKLTIEKCNFEHIVSPEANIISIEGTKNNKAFILHNNRFENCEVKYVYYIRHAGATTIISDNLYLLPTFNEYSSIYNIQSSSYGITIARELYQNIGNALHLGIVSPNVDRVHLLEYTYRINKDVWGYYDENNDYIGYYGTVGKPLFYIHTNINGVVVFPTCSLDNFDKYHFTLPAQVVMANLQFITDGINRIIKVPNPVQRLVFETSRMLLRKDGKDYDLSYLFQEIRGISNNRPQSPMLGSCYFDTTLNKPIWWNGTIWVDSSGAEV